MGEKTFQSFTSRTTRIPSTLQWLRVGMRRGKETRNFGVNNREGIVKHCSDIMDDSQIMNRRGFMKAKSSRRDMWKLIIHIPTINGSFSSFARRLVATDKGELFHPSTLESRRKIARRGAKEERQRSCPSRHPINTYKCPRQRDNICHFIYAPGSRQCDEPWRRFPFFHHQFPPKVFAYSNLLLW